MFVVGAEPFVHVHPVPVHIDRRDRDGDIFVDEPLHKVDVFLLRIRAISAPPVAESISRDKGHAARNPEKVFECGAVVGAVCENIFIDCVGFSRLDLAVLIQDKTFVLKYRNARLAHYAKLEKVNSEVAVKRSHRAFQVALVRCGNDRTRLRYDFRFSAFFVENESNRVGCDFHRVFGVFLLIFRRFEVTKPYRLRCVVDEFPRDGRFHAEKPVGKHGYAEIFARNHAAFQRLGVRYRNKSFVKFNFAHKNARGKIIAAFLYLNYFLNLGCERISFHTTIR